MKIKWIAPVVAVLVLMLDPFSTSQQRSGTLLESTLSREVYQRTMGTEAMMGAFTHIGLAASVPMGIEYEPSDGQNINVAGTLPPNLFVNPVRISDALRMTLDRYPQYEMSAGDGLISIAPKSLLQSTNHFLNKPIKKFEVKNMPFLQAVWKLRQAMNKDYLPWSADRFRNTPLKLDWAQKKLTLKLEGATPREILNRLVALHGEAIWTVTYSGQVGRVPAIEETCLIRLVPFSDKGGSIFSLAPFRGSRGGPRGFRGRGP